jgi:DNA-binding PadR family transcriptional regulator
MFDNVTFQKCYIKESKETCKMPKRRPLEGYELRGRLKEHRDNILRSLYSDYPKLNVRQFYSKLKISPTLVRRILDRLLKDGLIREEALKNQKLYSLTEKGRHEYLRLAVKNLDDALKQVRELTDAIQEDTEKLKDWKKKSREAVISIKIPDQVLQQITPSTSKAKVIELMAPTMEKQDEIYDDLIQGYKNLHLVISEIFTGMSDIPMFIGFKDMGSGLSFVPYDLVMPPDTFKPKAKDV